MCGIAGFLALDGAIATDVSAKLRTIIAMLAHRGPDHTSVWEDGAVGLCHARLSVLDLSVRGHQPMTDAQNRAWITYNGEIYNFSTLRSELEAAGCVFRSRSDTEVILQGYLHWGDDIFGKLSGMFAVAIWDANRRRLVLARDPIGKKPLIYSRLGNTFLFASECKAILAWPGVPRQPNWQALHDYLTFQYVPSPLTAFQGLHRLLPGHMLSIEAGGAETIRRFAEWPELNEPLPPVSDLAGEIRTRLAAAVGRRLIADVPVGALLSGGVDSSAVVALAAQQSARPLKTFSVGFREPSFDERPMARIVASRYGTDHHELELHTEAIEHLPRLAWHFDQPFADPSALATFAVAQLARQHVPVVLSGDGGDELFLGYTRYADFHRSAWVDRSPRMLRRLAGAFSDHLPVALENWRPARVLRRFATSFEWRNSRRYSVPMAYFRDLEKKAGYGPALQQFAAVSSLDRWEAWFAMAPDALSGSVWADLNSYLPDDILVKLDMATMAHGLEARCPLLDSNVVRLALSIPVETRMPQNNLKALFKQAVARDLPAEILERPKMGFGLPLERWLNNGLSALVDEFVLSSRAIDRGLFKSDYLLRIAAEHRSGRLLHHPRLWALIMLEMWFRTWIDGPLPPPPSGRVQLH